MRKLEPHPLIAYLEPPDDGSRPLTNVVRVERRDLKGSSIWAGPYLAFVVDARDGDPPPFRCQDHSDVGWAIGCLIHEWFMANNVPVSDASVTRALFSVEDVECTQELKCWFRVDMSKGQSYARPIVDGLDATSPGDYCSINDYLMTLPQYRKPESLSLRLCSLLIPENRVPEATRELTLRGDLGQELRYRVDADGTHEVTSRTPAAGGGDDDEKTLDEIIDIARKKHEDGGG